MNTVKAVLFDMDGVLVEAKDWHYESLNLALEQSGFLAISRQNHLSNYDGMPTHEKLKKHPQTKHLTKEEHIIINKLKQNILVEIIEEKCKPNPNVIGALRYLKKQNLQIACCSNSVRSSIEMMLEKSQVLDYMDFIISNEDVKYGKPSPDMYLKAMTKLKNVDRPTEVLICEDNVRGIHAARHSGAYVLEIGTVDDTNKENVQFAINHIQNNELPNQIIKPSIKTAHINDMVKGWFVGDFSPSILKSKSFEAGVKEYKKGDKESNHMHKVGTEITVVVRGKVIMCDRVISEGEMILMRPGIATSFEALEDTITFVVKTPSAIGDKYSVE